MPFVQDDFALKQNRPTLALKVCPRCGESKLATPEFYTRDKNRSCGLHACCKVCRRTAFFAKTNRLLPQGPRMGYKICTKCGSEKPATAEYFYRFDDKSFRPDCKQCVGVRSRVYRQTHRDQLKRYWATYHKDHAVQIRERDQLRYSLNSELRKSHAKDWKNQHPETRRIQVIRRRAKLRSVPGSFSVVEMRNLIKQQEGRCYYCGSVGTLSVDHKNPLSRSELNPTNSTENICMACIPCNSAKQTKTAWEYLIYRARRGQSVNVGSLKMEGI
mgnify:CR=1 FL=1